MTFLDEIRSQGDETWSWETFTGFDPDLHTAGLGQAVVGTSSYGRKRLGPVKIRTLTIPSRFKGITAANEMIETIHAARDLFTGQRGIVEGQQVYPPKTAGRDAIAKLVGQSNDLLMLGLVSGAAAAVLLKNRVDVTVVLPAAWKAQAKKPAMHASAVSLLKKDRPEVHVEGALHLDLDDLVETSSGHAMDALCMALVLAGYKL
jgi:hypothetical protein